MNANKNLSLLLEISRLLGCLVNHGLNAFKAEMQDSLTSLISKMDESSLEGEFNYLNELTEKYTLYKSLSDYMEKYDDRQSVEFHLSCMYRQVLAAIECGEPAITSYFD